MRSEPLFDSLLTRVILIAGLVAVGYCFLDQAIRRKRIQVRTAERVDVGHVGRAGYFTTRSTVLYIPLAIAWIGHRFPCAGTHADGPGGGLRGRSRRRVAGRVRRFYLEAADLSGIGRATAISWAPCRILGVV